MVFVKSELTSVIRNVEGTTRKVCLMLKVLTPHVHAPLPLRRGSEGCQEIKEPLRFASSTMTRVSVSSPPTWQLDIQT